RSRRLSRLVGGTVRAAPDRPRHDAPRDDEAAPRDATEETLEKDLEEDLDGALEEMEETA
ncbi:hypothetical protein ACWDAO_02000, partial [Streptomyces sp. NPDC001212]